MASRRLSSVKVLKSKVIPNPIFSAVSMFFVWSANIGTPTNGTPWYTASVVLPNPPCVMNNLNPIHLKFLFLHVKLGSVTNLIFGWPRTSCCGSHLLNLTFFGKPCISSVSHFHRTFCFSFPNTASNFLRFSSDIWLPFNMDPMLNRMKPSFPELDTKSSKSWCVWEKIRCTVRKFITCFTILYLWKWICWPTMHPTHFHNVR